jgi:hypothetical protein
VASIDNTRNISSSTITRTTPEPARQLPARWRA